MEFTGEKNTGLRTTDVAWTSWTGAEHKEDRDGEYEYIDDNKGADTYEREYGKADNTESETEINVLFAKQMFDNLKLGLVIGYSSEKEEPSNEYSYKEDFDVSDRDEFGTITYEESGTEGGPSEVSNISIGPSAEYQVNDKLSVGGGLSYIMGKSEMKYNLSQTEHCMMAYLDHAGAEIVIDNPGGGDVGTNSGGGAATSDWIASYSTVVSGKPDGTGFAGRIFAKYSLNDKTTLRGIVDFMSIPVTGNTTRTMIEDIKDDGYSGAGYGIQKQEILMSGDMDSTTAETTLGVGLENKLSENLLLGIGLKYTGGEEDMTFTMEGDVEIDGTKVGYAPKMEATAKETTSAIILPVGLEYKPNNWLSLRIGASHKIETIENEETETTTSYDVTVYPTKTVDSVETTVDPKEKEITRTTDFSFGAGFKVTENLQVDITRFANLTAMANWRISATLMF